MQYQPMVVKEYQSVGEIRADRRDLQRKFFDRPLLEIAEQAARDHKTALSLRNRVQQQLDEITSLVDESKVCQARIDDLRQEVIRMENEAADLARQKKCLEDANKASDTIVTFKAAMEAVACAYGLTPQVIKGEGRYKRAVAARRHLVHILATRRGDLSLPLVGRLLGGRDHTTILHARNSWPRYAPLYGREIAAVDRLLAIPPAVDNAHNVETNRPPQDDLSTD